MPQKATLVLHSVNAVFVVIQEVKPRLSRTMAALMSLATFGTDLDYQNSTLS
jgi:hypothetical protein